GTHLDRRVSGRRPPARWHSLGGSFEHEHEALKCHSYRTTRWLVPKHRRGTGARLATCVALGSENGPWGPVGGGAHRRFPPGSSHRGLTEHLIMKILRRDCGGLRMFAGVAIVTGLLGPCARGQLPGLPSGPTQPITA